MLSGISASVSRVAIPSRRGTPSKPAFRKANPIDILQSPFHPRTWQYPFLNLLTQLTDRPPSALHSKVYRFCTNVPPFSRSHPASSNARIKSVLFIPRRARPPWGCLVSPRLSGPDTVRAGSPQVPGAIRPESNSPEMPQSSPATSRRLAN